MVVSPASTHQGLPEAIPLKVLLANSDKRAPLLSPDGKYYAYLGNDANHVTNVFIQPVQWDTNVTPPAIIDAEPQQLTFETKRPLRFFKWAAASPTQRRLLYAQDTGGDENFHLYLVEFTVSDEHTILDINVRDLTPFDNVTAMMHTVTVSRNFPNTIILQLNKRDKRFFDAYKVDLETGDLELVLENPGEVNRWIVGERFEIVAAVFADQSDGSKSLRVPRHDGDKDAAAWKSIANWPHGEINWSKPVAKGDRAIYYETTLSHKEPGVTTNTSQLVLLSLEDGKEIEVVAQDPHCDLGEVSFNEVTRTVDFVVFNHTKPRVEILNDSIREDLEHLLTSVRGGFSIVSRSDDDQLWLYSDEPDDSSLKYFIYDRRTRHHALLFDSRPDLSAYSLVKMTPHTIQTSDNHDMVVFLSLPLGVEPQNLPLVLIVHGGPWARDVWGYHPMHQWLANRGYACLSVNFRGSTGYGKHWTNLGDGQWGAAMQQDLTDAVQWAIKQGIADEKRVAIHGGSYGGYAALAGLAFTPELFACGVDIVGPSNLKTLQSAIPAYWATLKKMFTLRMGDCINDDALNEKMSPLFHVDKMTKPLLIGQGANDPRVKRAESDQIAKKLWENKHDVEYVLYTDEGHGFTRQQNRIDFHHREEHFLAKYLGGRVVAVGDADVAGTSAVVIDPATL